MDLVKTDNNIETHAGSDCLSISVVSSPIYLGEGPHWDSDSQSLYFVDIFGQNILRLEYETNIITTAHLNHGPVGAVVPVESEPDKLLVACGKDILLVTWDGRQDVTDPPFKILASVGAGEKDTRVNDGKCDKSGRFWIGTMANEKPGGIIAPKAGGLYSFDGSKGVKQLLSQITISNGLAWNSRNDTMYYIDSMDREVVSFDFDLDTGNISNKRVVFDLKKHNYPGIPDGMTIDTDDNLWIVVHDGYAILHVNPRNGELLRHVDMSARRITSVAFGGPELDVLFVTSAYHGVGEDEKKERPHSGCVFSIKGLGVKGNPGNKFVYKK